MMQITVKQITNQAQKADISSNILNALPEWFGVEESKENYIRESKTRPFWAAYAGDRPVGFIALNATSQATAEVYVMGVLKSCHRAGAGRMLYMAFENYARAKGFLFAQVKTVQLGRYPEYDATNRFYMAMGFHELECFPSQWDEANPCQVYVKYIAHIYGLHEEYFSSANS